MDAPKPIKYVPASGKVVMFNDHRLDVTLRGSATIGRYPCTVPCDGDQWKVSQGEIFTGRLNMHNVARGAHKNPYLQVFYNEDKESDVVITVSSRAVHGRVTHNDSLHVALVELARNGDYENKSLKRHQRKDVALNISTVLYASYLGSSFFVMIMADLSKQGYVPLSPKNSKIPWSSLWSAFREK